MKFSAIDIGSNAVRLLICHVFDVEEHRPMVRKSALYRVPVRLGADAFGKGRISDQASDRLVAAMMGFKYLMKAAESDDYMACATSALRSAENGGQLVERIKQETGMVIEVIDGSREGELIALNTLDDRFRKGTYLFIDVGGGSTELTFQRNNRMVASRSFNVGTVRLKEDLVAPATWQEMKDWTRLQCEKLQDVKWIKGIGSGGNINKYFSLSRIAPDKPMSREKLQAMYDDLASMGLEERLQVYRLKPDRADVIVPAGRIYLSVMKWTGIEEIFVPQIGLADGLILEIFNRWKKKNGLI
ncbi:MAG: exopolyphosphatase [Magnetococcales bacterium]|nr:exopolyphosphatase [Magnetococcales bacterium]